MKSNTLKPVNESLGLSCALHNAQTCKVVKNACKFEIVFSKKTSKFSIKVVKKAYCLLISLHIFKNAGEVMFKGLARICKFLQVSQNADIFIENRWTRITCKFLQVSASFIAHWFYYKKLSFLQTCKSLQNGACKFCAAHRNQLFQWIKTCKYFLANPSYPYRGSSFESELPYRGRACV